MNSEIAVPEGMRAQSIRPGDLLLTTKLALVLIDQDLEERGFVGRRLSDGLQVSVPRAAVLAVYSSWTLAPAPETT